MRRPPRLATRLLPLAASALLAACATPPPPPAADTVAPPQWYAPLPHDGQLVELSRWWSQFNDPLLTRLIDAGQQASPTLASAQSRLAQAQAARTAAGAALLPTLDAGANAVRGRTDLSLPVGNSQSASLQAGWEIDVFGGRRAGRDAAQARLEGAQASWHVARVSVASEVAGTYVGLRACEAQVEQSQADATSRAESSRLTELAAKAGFQAPATAALARASAAQSNSLLVAQRAQCELSVKALVALTGLEEPALRSELATATGRLPVPAQIAVQSVPGTVLGQRPDVYAAARDVIAASAEVSQNQAARLPRITLAGSVGATRLQSGDTTVSGSTWAIGPLAVTLPLFDGGARRANVDAARARYDEAAVLYRAQLRGAVREVEQALVQLQSTEARGADAKVAAEGFEQSLTATEALYKNGAASLFQLEDARRTAVQARSALIDLQRERVTAWISLYRALGGGWDASRPNDGQQARN